MLDLILSVALNTSSPKPVNPEDPTYRGGSRQSMVIQSEISNSMSAKPKCPKTGRGSGRRDCK